MEQYYIESITKYADYLRLDQKLQVSFCDYPGYYNAYMHVLYPYSYHVNGFCNYIKSNGNAKKICVANNYSLWQKSKDGVFFGGCWAGMEEYVFPIRHGDSVLGFICVSGFRRDEKSALKRIHSVAESYSLDENDLIKKYYENSTDKIIGLDELKTLINPLCIMLESLYTEFIRSNKEGTQYSGYISLYQKILDIVCTNYAEDISVDGIARILNYSPTYISKLFLKNSGCHLSEYIVSLRIKRAIELLTNSSLSVSQIANSVGIPDANYFSTKFKRETGRSPTEYRKNVAKRKNQ